MGIQCWIDFKYTNAAKVFCSGEVLRGTVHLSVNEAISVRYFYVEIRGTSNVKWGSQSKISGRRTHSGSQFHLTERRYLGSANSDDGRLLAGSYEYNFECELPHDLPTSFESEFGRIQYKACVIMNFPEWPEKKFKIPFTVLRALDLREDLSLQETLHVNELKTFHTIPSIFCTLSDPLEMNCMLLIRGYTPGETIRLILATKNGSTQPVHGFIVQLIKKVVYRANAAVKVEKWILAETIARGCNVKEDDLTFAKLTVPSVSPTDDNEANLIRTSYYIKATGSVGRYHFDPVVKLPITIGVHPISELVEPAL